MNYATSMAPRKRLSDPIGLARTGKKQIPPLIGSDDEKQEASVPPSSQAGDELDKLVSLIQDQYKKKLDQQKKQSEEKMLKTMSDIRETVDQKIAQHDREMKKQMEELYSSLKVIETERIAQVDQIKLKYKEIKKEVKGYIKSIEQKERDYNERVEVFMQTMNKLDDELLGDKTREELCSIVPSVTPPSKYRKH